jgi:hypothetical protein
MALEFVVSSQGRGEGVLVAQEVLARLVLGHLGEVSKTIA